MSFGSTSGRGFEVANAHILWGVVILVTALLWLWFHLDIRRRTREEARDAERENQRDKGG